VSVDPRLLNPRSYYVHSVCPKISVITVVLGKGKKPEYGDEMNRCIALLAKAIEEYEDILQLAIAEAEEKYIVTKRKENFD